MLSERSTKKRLGAGSHAVKTTLISHVGSNRLDYISCVMAPWVNYRGTSCALNGSQEFEYLTNYYRDWNILYAFQLPLTRMTFKPSFLN
jgi:hypothetical protein